MSQKHAFAIFAVIWFAVWGFVGYLDPTVSVFFGLGAGALLAVGVVGMIELLDWAWRL